MAKELLYQEIVDKGRFEYKINDTCDLPLGNHGVFMEFPSMDKSDGAGWYPDETGCRHRSCIYESADITNRFSLNSRPGYCKCGGCEHLDIKDTIIHDIASIHKGTVVFAIEIINKHPPAWRHIEQTLNYTVFLIKAIDILKRVEHTPVYVYCLMGNRCWS